MDLDPMVSLGRKENKDLIVKTAVKNKAEY